MDFEKSGLPKHDLLEKAFKYSWKDLAREIDLKMHYSRKNIEQFYASERKNVEMGIRLGKISKEQGQDILSRSRQAQSAEERSLQQLLPKRIEHLFLRNRLKPALELVKTGDAAPELLAAIFLRDTVRSPKDFQEVSETFGSEVADVVAELRHSDIYLTQRENLLKEASHGVKRIQMVTIVGGLQDVLDIRSENKSIFVPEGQPEALFNLAKALRGTDEKLDQRFLEVFNAVGKENRFPFEIDLAEDGTMTLRKGPEKQNNLPQHIAPKTPPKGPNGPGGGGGGIGGDVF